MPHIASSEAYDVVLRDGSTVALRPATPEDAGAVRAFLEGLSDRSQYQRFLGRPRLDDNRIRTLISGEPGTCTLLAWCGPRIVAVAGFYRSATHPQRAEVAFAVADALQGRGIGTRLLERLAELATASDITVFEADVRSDNARMLEVFAESGFIQASTIEAGVTHVVMSLVPSPQFDDRAASRARTAAGASIRPFFEPRSVAVIGANRARGKIGSEILHNLIASGYTGTIAVVHPSAGEIQGHPAHRSIADVPIDIDLAVIAVPAAEVLAAVDDCIRKGVRALCVISAGFAEAGGEGATRETELLTRVRDAGIRLVGPNCMGLLNTDPRVSLNATFSPVYPPAGRVAMSTQSGALGLAILDYARRLNIGISSFVSVGNKADVSGNDLIQYWADDARTQVILLYLESFGNPKRFSQLARQVGRTKPIIAVKSGRSKGGAKAAMSHTGALAASDAVVDGLFRQAGVIRTSTIEELFAVATLLSHQPLPPGRRVAIVTNAGGPGILAADACEGHGLELATLSDTSRAELRGFLPPSASVGNPVDMLASAPAGHYGRTIDVVLHDPSVDAAIVIFIPPLVTGAEEVATAIREAAARTPQKPVLAVMMRAEDAPMALSSVPAYAFPEAAAIALARAAGYAEWRRKPIGRIPVFSDITRDDVRRPIDAALKRSGGWLTADETTELLQALGIRSVQTTAASTVEAAVQAAETLGFPVALKALGPTLLHKTERGAVILNLTSTAEVRRSANDLMTRLNSEISGFAVQSMVSGGFEMLVGCVVDPLFGPVLLCSAGGILTELLADSATRLHPLTGSDADEMVDELKCVRLLRGYRGQPALDERALKDVLLRISALVSICPELQELDINPLKILQSGACAIDVRVRVDQAHQTRLTRRVVY